MTKRKHIFLMTDLGLSIDISVHLTFDFTDAKDVPNLSPFRIFLRERGCFLLFRKAEVGLEKEGRGR